MKSSSSDRLLRLRLYLNLIPVLGIPASLWTLYTADPHQLDARLKQVSRTSIVLGMTWLFTTVLLSAGAHSEFSQLATLRFWIASSFVGSGYFATNLWLMFRVYKGRSTKLPGISQLSRRLPD
ncbi:MAG: hypothetical protein ACFB2W_04345 [Leptolyngbyaceae cyanobacterium]